MVDPTSGLRPLGSARSSVRPWGHDPCRRPRSDAPFHRITKFSCTSVATGPLTRQWTSCTLEYRSPRVNPSPGSGSAWSRPAIEPRVMLIPPTKATSASVPASNSQAFWCWHCEPTASQRACQEVDRASSRRPEDSVPGKVSSAPTPWPSGCQKSTRTSTPRDAASSIRSKKVPRPPGNPASVSRKATQTITDVVAASTAAAIRSNADAPSTRGSTWFPVRGEKIAPVGGGIRTRSSEAVATRGG